MKIFLGGAFVVLVLAVYWLITPSRKKSPRSQYTLPPLKPHTKDKFVKSMVEREKR